LHNGIEIGGHKFDFLGYSNSGLREHSVSGSVYSIRLLIVFKLWFVTPFMDSNNQMVDANVIRRAIGDFSGSLEYQPAKLGARLAQAFSTTERSVELSKKDIKIKKDIKAKPVFLDVEEPTKAGTGATETAETKPDVEKPTKNETETTESESSESESSESESSESESEPESEVVKSRVKIVREFTDGYGYMSPQLSREIWEALNPGIIPLPEPAPASYQVPHVFSCASESLVTSYLLDPYW
jgi:RNA dependent RNA polymerase